VVPALARRARRRRAPSSPFDKRSPVDGRVIAQIAEADRCAGGRCGGAGRAPGACTANGAACRLEQRVALLHAVADEINRRFDDFVAAEMADTGQPPTS
jgi:aminomuconate-semialdehyde/2-hydroxymuconate-6-semialdehyde dehydrogenase